MRLILLFLLPILVFADISQEYATLAGEPSSYIEGCVSAITGDLIIDQYDTVIQGAELLPIRRRYTNGQRNSTILPHATAFFISSEDLLVASEPNYLTIPYSKHKHRFVPDPEALSKGITCQPILGRGQYDPTKNSAELKRKDHLIIRTSNGGERHYRYWRTSGKNFFVRLVYNGNATVQNYLLEKEILPNGQTIHYVYEKGKEHAQYIREITIKSPASSQTLSRALFEANETETKIQTSDGRQVCHTYTKRRLPKELQHAYQSKTLTLMQEASGPIYPKEHLDYNRDFLLKARGFPSGRVLSFKYDSYHRVCKIRGPNDFKRTISYEGPITSSYDRYGNQTQYIRDQNYRLIEIKYFQGRNHLLYSEKLSWTLSGKLLARSNELSTRSHTYDTCGNPTFETLSGSITSLGSQDQHTIHRTYSEDGRNLLLREEYPNGKTVTYSYLEGTDLPTTISSELLSTTYHYDEDNLLIQEITTGGSQSRTKRIHNRSEQPFFGMAETIDHVEQGRKEHLHYDAHGQISSKEIYDTQGDLAYTLQYTYDEKGRLISETNPTSQIAHYNYDENGNLIHEITFSGLHKTYSYDASNRCTQETTAHQKTQHAYNSLGHKTSTTDHLGATTHYAYDALGRLLIETNPLGATTSYTYDALGNPITSTDPLGNTTHTCYNIYGKPLQITHPDNSTESYTYTLEGNLESYTDKEGTTTRYTYDILDRELTKIITDSSGNILSEESTTYTPFHKSSHTNALGHTTTYVYNAAGQLITETYADRTTIYTYDSLGRKATQTTSPLTIHYTYDLLDRVHFEKHYHNSTLIYQEDTTYDTAGNIATKTRYPGNQPATEGWEYDPLNREIAHTDALGHTTTTDYLETDRLIKTIHHPDGTETVETYNCLNELLSVENRQGANTLHNEVYTYDLAGNEISRTHNQQFQIEKSYDNLNRRAALTENQTKTTSYTYTPTGKISTLTKPSGAVLQYTYTGLGHLEKLSSTDIDYTYTYNALGGLLSSTNHITGRSLNRTLDPHGRILSETFP
ncbi:MAG: putative deoxyribonuclease RhsB, partial [Chlamydiae bacterium]|nr:putative deoxyribonuclease RhsB [Chlamydiota bacterium]